MKYSNIIYNDVVNGDDVSVSLFVQGCPHHCKGCFNPETWDFNTGIDISIDELIETIKKAIVKNNIQRNFNVLGGEPLCEENIKDVQKIVHSIKTTFPSIKIWIWTGYTLTELYERELQKNDNVITQLLKDIDILVDGKFILEEQDFDLFQRGSRNQKILIKGKDF